MAVKLNVSECELGLRAVGVEVLEYDGIAGISDTITWDFSWGDDCR